MLTYVWARVASCLKPFHDFPLQKVTAACYLPGLLTFCPGTSRLVLHSLEAMPFPSHFRPPCDTAFAAPRLWPRSLLLKVWFWDQPVSITWKLIRNARFKPHPRPQVIRMHSWRSPDLEFSCSPRQLFLILQDSHPGSWDHQFKDSLGGGALSPFQEVCEVLPFLTAHLHEAQSS